MFLLLEVVRCIKISRQTIIQSLLIQQNNAVLSSELSKDEAYSVSKRLQKICVDWGVFKQQTDFNKAECKLMNILTIAI